MAVVHQTPTLPQKHAMKTLQSFPKLENTEKYLPIKEVSNTIDKQHIINLSHIMTAVVQPSLQKDNIISI